MNELKTMKDSIQRFLNAKLYIDNENTFDGLAFLLCEEITEDHVLFVPDELNIKMVQVLKSRFPNIELLDNHKESKQPFILFPFLKEALKKENVTAEEIIEGISSNALIVKNCPQLHEYYNLMSMGAKLAGNKKRHHNKKIKVFKGWDDSAASLSNFKKLFLSGNESEFENSNMKIYQIYSNSNNRISFTVGYRIDVESDIEKLKQMIRDRNYKDINIYVKEKKKQLEKEIKGTFLYSKNYKLLSSFIAGRKTSFIGLKPNEIRELNSHFASINKKITTCFDQSKHEVYKMKFSLEINFKYSDLAKKFFPRFIEERKKN